MASIPALHTIPIPADQGSTAPREHYADRPSLMVSYAAGWRWGAGATPKGIRADETELDFITRKYGAYPDREDAAQDGYLDASAGRAYGHSVFCRAHGRGPGECGVA